MSGAQLIIVGQGIKKGPCDICLEWTRVAVVGRDVVVMRICEACLSEVMGWFSDERSEEV